MADLLELAKRCEAATKTTASLDYDIAKAVGVKWGSGDFGTHFTASIDAALTLVPEEWLPLLDSTDALENRHYAELFGPDDTPFVKGCAPTIALAICAAALRARAAQ